MLWSVAVLQHNEKLDPLWDSQTRHLRYFFWGLRDHRRINMQLIVPKGIAKCCFLFRITNIPPLCSQLIQHGVVNTIEENH